MNRLVRQPLSFLALVAIATSAGCQTLSKTIDPGEQSASAQPNAAAQSSAPRVINADSPDYVAQIVEQVGPAVVRIDSSRVVEQPFGDLGFDPFFGRQQAPQQRVQRGTGSGFITTADGRILTNAHVVEGADNVTVVLKDGRRFKGEVLGADSVTDVAVVKIGATGLPTVKVGNSNSLLPGQAAIAIGNPLGLDNTVTQGIVSATGRSGADFGSSARTDFIQTDTAINPGNSGGPLINSSGEVIGINTAIIQGASGIGFAVPIATAQRVAEQIVTKGRVDHPYLGIQMGELTPELREQINRTDSGVKINQDQGIIIIAVQPNSPAARAGLRPGDLIESINGTAIQTSQQVLEQVEATSIGNTLEMKVNRNGQSRNIAVKPGALPTEERS